MPEPSRVAALIRRGRGEPAQTEEPPAANTPRGLFLRKLREKNKETPDPQPASATDPKVETVPTPHTLEQGPSGVVRDSKTAAQKRKANEVYTKRQKAWPLAILKQLHKDFQWEWVDWEPEAIWDAFEGEVPGVTKDIVGALHALLRSESFWTEFHIFLWGCQAFNGRQVDFRIIPDLEPYEIMYGVMVAHQIRDEGGLKIKGKKVPGVKYSPEVLATIAAAFRIRGMVYVPPPVEGATSLLLEQVDASVKPLSAQAKAAWVDLGKATADETPLGVQVAGLKLIAEYTKDVAGA